VSATLSSLEVTNGGQEHLKYSSGPAGIVSDEKEDSYTLVFFIGWRKRGRPVTERGHKAGRSG